MNDQKSDYFPLTTEQLEALNDTQKEIFSQLDEKDRQFFAEIFSPESLGQVLERKWEAMQKRERLAAYEQRVKASIQAQEPAEDDKLTAGDIAAGAAGVAGLVGIGVMAKKLSSDGKATWRGVETRALVNPLVSEFARQEKTDIRFTAPNQEGNMQAVIFLRGPSGLVPALTILLTQLTEAAEVEISQLSSKSVLETAKDQGKNLIDLIQDGLRWKRSGDAGDLLDLAGEMWDKGFDVVAAIKDLDLEDRAWEVILRTADPLQAQYDEKMAIINERRLKLEIAWDDYQSCPQCRVAFGAEDKECRVCGAERPPMPNKPDPRSPDRGK